MITVGTTVPAYVMATPDTWGAWLLNAEEIAASHDVRFFAAIETDARGLEPFAPLLDRLTEVNGEHWTFSFDDGADEITSANRLRRITMGQNIVTRYAQDVRSSHLLFMAADCAAPGDAIPKLLELQWPIVGGEVTTYCLSGSEVLSHPSTGQLYGFPVQSHMATAAFIMIHRDLLNQIHWRYDVDTNESDDPCFYKDALALGYQTLVRKDCVGTHYPQIIGPMEHRFADRVIRR